MASSGPVFPLMPTELTAMCCRALLEKELRHVSALTKKFWRTIQTGERFFFATARKGCKLRSVLESTQNTVGDKE